MKLQYLGTAAAEGWPALFCDCEACRKARATGGRNIRTRSQAIIDDRLLIDLGPDTYHHCLAYGVDLSFIQNVLITHAHQDHWQPEELGYRADGFAAYQDTASLPPLTVWGTSGIAPGLQEVSSRYGILENGRVVYRQIEPFDTVQPDGYTVTALPANHDDRIQPVFYQITDGKSTLLYANDTGIPDETVWRWWAEDPVHLDFVSLDCTGIVHTWRDGHMGMPANAEMLERLAQLGLVDEKTQVCLHHFSHNGGLIYDELAPIAQERGWLVSYDGMTVTF